MVKWGESTHKLASGRVRLPKVEIFQRGAKRLNGKLDRADPCNHKSPKVWKDLRTERSPKCYFAWAEEENINASHSWTQMTKTDPDKERGEKRLDAQVTSGKCNHKVEQRVTHLAPKMGKKRKGHQDKSLKLQSEVERSQHALKKHW